MEESNCQITVRIYPQISELDDLQSTFIVNCVLNSFICYTAIMLNIFTIYAIAKTSALPKPLKSLLLSVAVSDLGVGLIVEPFFLSLFIKGLQLRHLDCFFHIGLLVVINLFCTTSFLNVIVISVERFLALQLHLRYQTIVTHKRVVGAVIFIWTYAFLASFTMFFFPFAEFLILLSTFSTIFLLVTTALYCKIYFITRRHKRQILAQKVQGPEARSTLNGEMRSLARSMKTAVGVLYIYFAFLVCYVPNFIYVGTSELMGPNIVMTNFHIYSLTLVFFDSSLNPIVYCWWMRHIRRTMVATLRRLYTNCMS